MGFGTRKGFKKRAPLPKPQPKKVGPATKFKADAIAGFIKSTGRNVAAADAYLQSAGMGDGGGSSGGGGGGGGYGGGGGGFIDYYAKYEPYRAELRRQLEGLKGAAPAAFDQYRGQYDQAIRTVADQSRGLTAQYGNDIRSVMADLLGQAQGADASLQRDLSAQGADVRALGAQSAANAGTMRAYSGAGDVYNNRLAQLQAMAEADRMATGAAIDQSARGTLENEYMRQLAAIGMLGM
jgi:hypothetical protein